MKKQKYLFQAGDIVKNFRNNSQRLIVKLDYTERSGMLKAMYYYYKEELDELYRPTGLFNQLSIGYCSQDHLLRWKVGR